MKSLLCNGNCVQRIIVGSAESWRCSKGGVASWSPDPLAEGVSCISCSTYETVLGVDCWIQEFHCSIKWCFTLFCSEKLLHFFPFLYSLLKWRSPAMGALRISCGHEAVSPVRQQCVQAWVKELKDTKIKALRKMNGKDIFRLLAPKDKLCLLQPGPTSVNKDGAAKWREKSLWRRLEWWRYGAE